MEFYDRYEAMGIPYPDPETMCKGDCEGTGVVPIKNPDWVDPTGKMRAYPIERPSDEYMALWAAAEAKNPTDDGWHFVTCPTCNGSRMRK